MESRLELISSLLEDIDNYIKQGGTGDKQGFLKYLLNTNYDVKKEIKTTSKGAPTEALQVMERSADQGAILAFHLHRLGKYAKYYIKESFKNSALLAADDFGFLAAIIEHKEISKTALISYNLHEVPSGMEIIRRLISRGLVMERVNQDDRRIKMLSHTELGLKEFIAATAQMQQIARVIAGDLKETELQHLNAILKRLDLFHLDIHRKAEETNNTNLSVALGLQPGS